MKLLEKLIDERTKYLKHRLDALEQLIYNESFCSICGCVVNKSMIKTVERRIHTTSLWSNNCFTTNYCLRCKPPYDLIINKDGKDTFYKDKVEIDKNGNVI